jgi:hypothetical protein
VSRAVVYAAPTRFQRQALAGIAARATAAGYDVTGSGRTPAEVKACIDSGLAEVVVVSQQALGHCAEAKLPELLGVDRTQVTVLGSATTPRRSVVRSRRSVTA